MRSACPRTGLDGWPTAADGGRLAKLLATRILPTLSAISSNVYRDA
jgi:hypothetical protein